MTTVVVPASVEVGVKSISVGLVLGRQTMLSQMRHKIKLQQNICVALFLLHEVFDYPFSEIGSMLEKSPANCRQIFHRARQALQDKRARFEPEPQRQRQLLFSFLSASQAGDMAALTSLLAQDAVSWSDGGGKVQSNLKPIHGQQAVARFWLSVMRKNQRPLTETLAEINGSPAILFWEEGSLAGVMSLTLSAVGIQEIYALLNPEKLAYLQKQLSSCRRRSSFES